ISLKPFQGILCRKLNQHYTIQSRTRVNIGSAFQHWSELKEREGLRSDAEVALFLLDRRVTLVLLCFTEQIYAGFCLNMLVCHNCCLGCLSMCGAELSKWG
uniref:Uncharacterized protein n=1 Tax=Sinocyclocheilus anshuiensis TaxID=1608454 RepID=A0A671RMY3_9TELE